jgi:hypothetical protein
MNLPTNYEKLSPRERKEVREEYVRRQKGRCMFCNELLINKPPAGITSKYIDWRLFPPNFLKWPVHLQHDHNTGMTEGAVHAYCNAYMWFYEGR